ncbi:winged helix-turn-helix domain-containing protein [Thiofilum flexile]|uniref:winged helix-turn-helix domain-containing protein n=1 Tax=Thiofilum flexile TaxID=125627 RepID=UPI0003798BCA|nr:crosslink repair DNA glycosylase YcaQ family protein [Thiofilum flexile]
MITLSPDQARILVLHCQRLPASKPAQALATTLNLIEHLGYVQIDTISVVERAHHHTLWSRNPGYAPEQLDTLLAERQVFEYWAHAAAYLPMRDFRFTLPRKAAIASGELDHWYARDTQLMHEVLERIRQEEPLQARDFEGSNTAKPGDWHSKPAKRALEYLFHQGDLMVTRRQGFQKVFDLSERVLPPEVDTRMPTPQEQAHFLLTRFLEANGLGQVAEAGYLRKQVGPLLQQAAQDMLEEGTLVTVQVEGHSWLTLPRTLELLEAPLALSTISILSPFDNLLIQRRRMQALFGFDYQIECYLPAAKRRFGYFSLPVLWKGCFVARIDCKAERRESILKVLQFVPEPHLKADSESYAAFGQQLEQALTDFMSFNRCQSWVWQAAERPDGLLR